MGNTLVHAQVISPPEAGKQGWLDRLWKLGFLVSGDFLAPVVLPEDMRCVESADEGVSSMAKRIGWLGEGRGFRVVILRGVLPRLGGAGEWGGFWDELGRGHSDLAGEAICHYEFYKSLFY